MINKKFGRRNFVKLSTGGIISDGDSSGNTFAKEASKQTQSGSKPIRIGFAGIGGVAHTILMQLWELKVLKFRRCVS